MKSSNFTRRIVSMLLALCMVLPMTQPLSVWAAAPVTVYLDPVSGSDSNTGLAQAQPVKTVEKAYEQLAAAGGTLVFLSDLTLTANLDFPACSHPVTITSATGNEGIVSSESVRFTGDTTLEHMKVKLTRANGSAYFSGEGYKFTIGEGMKCLPNYANTSGNKYYFCLAGGGVRGNTNGADFTVLSGDWRTIYVGGYTKAANGAVTASLSNCTARLIAPSYSGAITGDVTVNLQNVSVSSAIYYSNDSSKAVTGNVTYNLIGDVYAPKLCKDAGTVSGNVTVNLVGGNCTITNLLGDGDKTTLNLNSGTVASAISGWGSAVIDVAAEDTLTLAGKTDVDSVTCAGTLAFDNLASLHTPQVNGAVNVTFDRVLKNHLYITAPADAGFVFPDGTGLAEENGQWIIHDMENFEGLMIRADSDVTMKFYQGYGTTAITAHTVKTHDGVTDYYFPNALGEYRYQASKTGYYTLKQDIYMSEEEQAAWTIEQVTMEKTAGNGWEPSTVTSRSDEADASFNNKEELWWKNYKDSLVSPYFTQTDKAAHQMTTQEELEAFIAQQDMADDMADNNMYVYNLGKSDVYDFNIPVVIFTETDLSSAATLEQAAALLAQSDKPLIEYRAQMHGNESAAGEGALNMIPRLLGAYGEKVLETTDLYMIPRLNADGAYKYKREVISGTDPNRDLIRLETVEMQLHQKLFLMMQPELIIDGHERGYKYDYADVGIGTAVTVHNTDNFWQTTKEIVYSVFSAYDAQELSGCWYSDDVNTVNPNISRGYSGNAGTLFVLLESIGYDMGNEAYEERVIGQIVGVSAIIDYVAEHADQIKDVVAKEKAFFAQIGATYEEEDIISLSTKRVTNEELGIMMDVFDMGDGTVTPTLQVPGKYDTAERYRVAPTAYVLPADTQNIDKILELVTAHGIAYYRLSADSTVQLQQYTGTVEEAALTEEKEVIFKNGAYVFCMNQSTKNILAMLMEPDVTDAAEYSSTLAQRGWLPADGEGNFPIYRYVKNLNADGKIDYVTMVEAPQGLKTQKATGAESNGAITGLNSQRRYEYRAAGATEYTPVPTGSTQITGLAGGVYYVRYQATQSADAICLVGSSVTVYLSDDNGADSNSGDSAAAPVKTLEAAYAKLSAAIDSGAATESEGTIVLLDDYLISIASPYDLPAHSYSVKIVAQNSSQGITYNTSGSTANNVVNFNGPTQLDDMTITKGSSNLAFLCGNGHPFVIGEGITCVPKSGYYPNLVGGNVSRDTVNANMTILGGTWRNIYAGGYRASTSGNVSLVMKDATITHLIQPSYTDTTSADVYMDLQDISVASIYCGHASAGTVSGDVTLVLRSGVSVSEAIHTGSRDAGNVTGTVTIMAAGADLSQIAITNSGGGTVAKGVLAYADGTVTPVSGLDQVGIDTSAGGRVIVPEDLTVDYVIGGGAVELKSGAELTVTGTVTGMTTVTTEVALSNVPYIYTATRQPEAAFVYAGEGLLQQTAENGGFQWQLRDAEEAAAAIYAEDAVYYFQNGADALTFGGNTENACVTLFAPITGEAAIAQSVAVDLNSYSIDSVVVEKGAVLTVKDSATADFTVQDGVYGKIGQIAGDGTLVGMEDQNSVVYMKVTEEDGVSFHAVDLRVGSAVLRSFLEEENVTRDTVGLYYKSDFSGDEKVAANVAEFGVALSVTQVPQAHNLQTDCGYSVFTSFAPGAGSNADTTGTVLYDIMKPTSPRLTNEANAKKQVFARNYIKTKDGQYVFGTCVTYCLQEIVELYNDQLAEKEGALPESVRTWYETYTDVMRKWDIPYIIEKATQAQIG